MNTNIRIRIAMHIQIRVAIVSVLYPFICLPVAIIVQSITSFRDAGMI